MLYDVLHAIENASGPVLLSDLSRELGIVPDMLRDMLAFWQRKGRLNVQDSAGGEICASGTACGSLGSQCGATCSGSESCLFTARIPIHTVITLHQPDP